MKKLMFLHLFLVSSSLNDCPTLILLYAFPIFFLMLNSNIKSDLAGLTYLGVSVISPCAYLDCTPGPIFHKEILSPNSLLYTYFPINLIKVYEVIPLISSPRRKINGVFISGTSDITRM
jgi:hypothetical protein